MHIRHLLQFVLGLGLALAACAVMGAADKPNGHKQICIVSEGEVWSELAPCG